MKPVSVKLAFLVLAVCVACAWATPAFAQQPPSKPTVKRGVAPQTPVDSGAAMYQAYCAACHGVRGAGDGPAVPALKTPPPDLRTLAQKNKGTFPAERVQQVLTHGVPYAAHGSGDMPIWGPTLRSLSGDEGVTKLRIANITDFVKSLQTK